jgi:hypothetical protein
MSPPGGYENQTYTVEITVNGPLDGATLGPPVTALVANDDPQQIYRPDDVDALGLIDVDYIVEASGSRRLGAMAARIVHVLWISDAPVPGDAGAAVQVVDNVDSSPVTQTTIAPLVGLTQFYRDTPFLVPQGSMLRLVGFSNPGGAPIKVRLTIQYVEDMIAAQAAICRCNSAEGQSALITPVSTGLQVTGLNAAFVGSTNDTTGRFDGLTVNLGDRALADWVTRNTGSEATDGTEFKITLPGLYGVVGYLATTANGNIEGGVTLDGIPTIDPVMSDVRTLSHYFRRLSTLGGADSINASYSGFAMVTEARAAGAATGVIRYQVSNNAGGPPTNPPLNAADCVLKIVRLANLA